MSPCLWCDTLADCTACLPRLAWEGQQPDPHPPARACPTCVEVEHFLDLGESAHQAARALGVTVGALARHMAPDRHNRPDLLTSINTELRGAHQ